MPTRTRKKSREMSMIALGALSIATVAILVLIPIGYMLYGSLTNPDSGAFSVAEYFTAFTTSATVTSMRNSLVVAVAVGLGSVIIAIPLAFGSTRTSMRGKRIVNGAVIASIVTPDFLVAMAYIILMGPNAGLFNEWIRTIFNLESTSGPFNIFSIWGFVFIALPRGVAFVYLSLVPAFQNSDPAMEEAARISGGSPLRVLATITLPVLRPAILSGALITFALTIAMFGTPYMLNVDVLTIAIRQSLILNFNFQVAATLSIILTIMCLLALGAYQLSIRREGRFRTVGGKSFSQRKMDVPYLNAILSFIAYSYAAVAVVMPFGIIAISSFMKGIGRGFSSANFTMANYSAVFGSKEVLDSFLNSFMLAAAAATILCLVTPLIAYYTSRSRSKFSKPIEYLALIPMGIPGTAIAVALIIAYLNKPLSSIAIYGTLAILLLAYLSHSLPFGVRMSSATLIQFSGDLEEASRLSGANRLTTIFRITMPLMKSTIIYVWMLVFILTFPEMSASVMLAGIDSQVASTMILDLWAGSGGLTTASAAAMVMLVGILILFIAAQLLGSRSRVRVKSQFL